MSGLTTNAAVNEILDNIGSGESLATIETSLANIDSGINDLGGVKGYSQTTAIATSSMDTKLTSTNSTLGDIKSNTSLLTDAIKTTGSGIGTKSIAFSGTDGTNARILSTDTSGRLNIAAITGAVTLPNGASTSALQTTGNTSLSTIATNTNNLLLGTVGAITSVTPSTALSSGNQTLITANASRRGLTIYNNTNHLIFVALGTTANTTTSFSLIIPTNSLYEVMPRFVGLLVSFSITNGSASGTVLITALT